MLIITHQYHNCAKSIWFLAVARTKRITEEECEEFESEFLHIIFFCSSRIKCTVPLYIIVIFVRRGSSWDDMGSIDCGTVVLLL